MPRRLYWVIVHAVIFLAFARYLVAPLVDRRELAATDFTVFYTGWSLVLSDPGHTYDVEAQRRVQAGIMGDRHFEGGVMTFYYPPHAAVALAPFAVLGFENAFRLWIVLQLACAFLLIRWLQELAGARDSLDRWVVATAVLAFLPLLYSLQIGQLSIAMTLALVGLWRAFVRGRDAHAGLWLLALTIKPQLLPVPLLLLLATRRLRPLGWLCLWAAPLALVASVVLGPRVWLDYPAYARRLEGFVAGGSHDHMLNLRGFLTRLAGPGHDGAIFAVSAAVLALVSAGVYALFRRDARRGPIAALTFAAGLALQLPVNLHLHLQDALLWVVPLAIFAGHLREGGGEARRFELFALSWPLVFVLTAALETATGRLLPVPPALVLAVILAAWLLRAVSRSRSALA
jgi:Glycosyltransferase family 87